MSLAWKTVDIGATARVIKGRYVARQDLAALCNKYGTPIMERSVGSVEAAKECCENHFKSALRAQLRQAK